MRLHATTNYANERYDFLKLVEGYRQFAYVDTAGIATIGIGINLRQAAHQDLVLREFGFDLDSSLGTQGATQANADEQRYIERIRAELNSASHTTTSVSATSLL